MAVCTLSLLSSVKIRVTCLGPVSKLMAVYLRATLRNRSYVSLDLRGRVRNRSSRSIIHIWATSGSFRNLSLGSELRPFKARSPNIPTPEVRKYIITGRMKLPRFRSSCILDKSGGRLSGAGLWQSMEGVGSS